MRRVKQGLVVGAFALALAGGTASASFFITSINQISPHVRSQLKGNRGARGARGAQGPAGTVGAVHEVAGVTQIAGTFSSGNAVVLAEATCPSGQIATGGGFGGDTNVSGEAPVDVTTAASSSEGNGWAVILINQTDFSPAAVKAVAECVPVGSQQFSRRIRVTTHSAMERELAEVKAAVQ